MNGDANNTQLVSFDDKSFEKTLKEYLLSTDTLLSDNEFILFLNIARSARLNPFLREIYAVKYGSNFNIITGYEVYLKRAEDSGQADGHEIEFEGDICEEEVEKDFWEGKGDARKKVTRKAKVWRGDLRCTIRVYRKDRTRPYTKTIWFNEYTKDNAMWFEKPRTMLEKVAITQGYRMAFPKENGGIPYTADELPDPDCTSAKIIEAKPSKADSSKSSATNGKTTEEYRRMVVSILKNLGFSTEEEQLDALRFILNNPCIPNFNIPKEDCFRFWARMEVFEGTKHEKGHKRTAQEYRIIRDKIEELKHLGEEPCSSLVEAPLPEEGSIL